MLVFTVLLLGKGKTSTPGLLTWAALSQPEVQAALIAAAVAIATLVVSIVTAVRTGTANARTRFDAQLERLTAQALSKNPRERNYGIGGLRVLNATAKRVERKWREEALRIAADAEGRR